MKKSVLIIRNLLSIMVCLVFIMMAAGSIDTNDPNYVSFSEIKEKMKDPNYWKTTDNSTMAYIMMEDFVKGRLKAPSTAKFPGILDGRSDHISYLGNQKYRINSYVDAQNSFGAMIRTRFSGVIEQISRDRWVLRSLTVG